MPALQGLTWQRLFRFGKWQVWHTVDAHNVALCGQHIIGTHQKSADPWTATSKPTGAKDTDMCLPCAKVRTDMARQQNPTQPA